MSLIRRKGKPVRVSYAAKEIFGLDTKTVLQLLKRAKLTVWQNGGNTSPWMCDQKEVYEYRDRRIANADR